VHSGGKWDSVLARAYYTLGSAYYVVHWIAALGLASLLASVLPLVHQRIIVGLSLAFVGITSVVVAAWLTISSLRHRLNGTNPTLRIVKVEEIYTDLGDGRFDSTRDLTMQAASAGAASYVDKFIWTGTGHITPRIDVPPDARVVLEDEPFGYRKILRVWFPRQLRKNESIRIRYTLELHDTESTARPFLSVGANEWGLRKLILRVNWKDTVPPLYKRQLFASITSDLPVFEDSIIVARSEREGIWTIPKPHFGWEYRIVW
jgi:hypothetical protein